MHRLTAPTDAAPLACLRSCGAPVPHYRNARGTGRGRRQSRGMALTGIMVARRASTASMISALSMPWS
jgi:hypothetical protein